ncbi:GDSL-type esterase/lipase family protein [Dysgonomonas reticulitermitis]
MNKRKKVFIVLFIISVVLNIALAGYVALDYYRNKRNKDIFKLNAYAWMNSQLEIPKYDENRVVFIGNSITENWIHLRYKFFSENNYICRGIGGQTSSLLLLRFRQDVIELKPKVVVINAGINDIAENTGTYDPDFTLGNIKSMAELAKINNIKVILSSVLPSNGFGWRGGIENIPEKINQLNDKIKSYAQENGFYYVDYNTPMKAEDSSLKASYTFDGLHPNEDGYIVMETLVQNAINSILNDSQTTKNE